MAGYRASGGLTAAEQLLNRIWGFESFRSGQKKAILAIERGRDCVAVLPTGGGKSICYQVPALLSPGLSLVVSPLLSLMQDQVAALRTRGVPASYLGSSLTPDQRRDAIAALRAGRTKLLYLSPEQLPRILARQLLTRVDLLAVDEAHCISEWGHEFRPHYRSLGKHRARLGTPPTIAVTGTATRETRRDIERVLGLRNPVRILNSFDRPNLHFRVERHRSDRSRLLRLKQLVSGTGGSVIVYVPTRNRTDAVCHILNSWGIWAAPYHAGLPAGERKRLLREFLDGSTKVMVATNAFGMGIDKPDVRIVAHLGVPPRPEAYYQEAGRAGRDGKRSLCTILWIDADLDLARYLSGTSQRTEGSQYLRARRRGFDAMKKYVGRRACRRQMLLRYFGEAIPRCGDCDYCVSTARRRVATVLFHRK